MADVQYMGIRPKSMVQIVSAYSAMGLAFTSDKLIAIGGISQRFQPILDDGVYFWRLAQDISQKFTMASPL
jgi:hypothetical protein